eukprot:CAMPEP_0181335314 /NCGR_PEP_ID=MMETSP1101-20121128/26763_1 /TAXON_ID=46948 /ORGANISM="Rhodomonas abbreviata, Strain Caron Lab Isolate" /LENGTH=73 /DNA_ID=CAMNT_0023445421 /DNA_START=192 /DNA_END=410 /DNA_ORIENTATION=-
MALNLKSWCHGPSPRVKRASGERPPGPHFKLRPGHCHELAPGRASSVLEKGRGLLERSVVDPQKFQTRALQKG